MKRLERLLSRPATAYPAMLALLALVFWITIVGANYPSQWLSNALFRLQEGLSDLFFRLKAPIWLHGVVVEGAFRTTAWVVSVMLPPMVIFFPLFTLLEDTGCLNGFARHLDRPFRCCGSCGKQALTMTMGYGCNAVGVTGCRMIRSPRQRLMATLTNSFAPCNGRFPTMIALISIYFAGASTVLSSLVLTLVIVFGVGATFLSTWILSKTLLRGSDVEEAVEAVRLSRPQWGNILKRAMREKTLVVLGSAVSAAIPAGALLWVLANVGFGGDCILGHAAALLEPVGRFLGLDGAILLAFILGLPANEIVLPIIMMIYLSQGSLIEAGSLAQTQALLSANGWTWLTAVCFILFSLMHWPCATTLITIRRETGKWRWSLLAAVIPTVMGFAVCGIICTIVQSFVHF